MGYTHYWEQSANVSDEQWTHFCHMVDAIIDASDEEIVREPDDVDNPAEISKYRISFNGAGDDGYETFFVGRKQHGFACCKTAYRPYDTVVVACCIAGLESGVFDKWSSDGDSQKGALDAGRKLFARANIALRA